MSQTIVHSMQRGLLLATLLTLPSACTNVIDSTAVVDEERTGQAQPLASLSLDKEGETLVLAGTPLDLSFRGVYPNPRVVDVMNVDISMEGKLDVQCLAAGADAPCSDPPFFVKTDRAGDGLNVVVRDLFGEVVYEGYAITSAEEGPTDEFGGDASGDGDDEPGAPCSSEFGDCDEPAEDGPGATCDEFVGCNPDDDDGVCELDMDAFRARFCADVNARIEELGLEGTYDCAGLDPDRPTPELGDDAVYDDIEIGCRDVVEELAEEAEDVVDQDEDCEDLYEDEVDDWEDIVRVDLMNQGTCGNSPIVLDLKGDGFSFTSTRAGVRFDLLGNGAPVRSAWTDGADDAFLILDRNGNGLVDGAAELFGNRSGGRAHADGFAALAELDENGDGRIDRHDGAFASLRLWLDADHDGRGGAAEWITLADGGVAALSLAAATQVRGQTRDENGNHLAFISHFVRLDGTAGEMVDVLLRYEPRSQSRLAELEAMPVTAGALVAELCLLR